MFKFEENDDKVFCIKDSNVELSATIQALPKDLDTITIEWTHDGKPIANSEKHKITKTKNAIQLAIQHVQRDDAGHYTLYAKTDTGETSQKDIELHVEDRSFGDNPPNFIRRLNDLAAKVGTRTRLLVEIRSSTDVRVTWYRNDRRICENDRINFVNEGSFYCLEISSITLDDGGKWMCMAENLGGRNSCLATLNVLVPKAYKSPEFLEELRAILTEQGTVSLECKVVGVPTPLLRWFKDSKEIKAGDVFALTANPHDDLASLGTYTCEAVNCMGKTYSSSKLHISGRASRESSLQPGGKSHGPPPIFTSELKNMRSKIGDGITLGCQVMVPPWPKSVTWYNKDGKIESSEKYKLIEDGLGSYILEIKPAEYCDEGEWKFVVTSSEGTVSISTCFVHMDVPKNYRKPRFMENLKAILTEEGLVSFECKVVGFPTPLLRWFKDGHELKPGDVYQLTGTNSLGSYSCIAKNCMGEATSSAVLTLEDIQNQLNENERIELQQKNQPPKFIKGLLSTETKINEEYKFTVQIKATTEPIFSWYRDDLPIDKTNEKYEIATEKVGFCHLLIKCVEFVDQAEWKCVATNEYGHSTSTCFLKLQIPRHFKKPRFLECLRAVLTEEGAVNLECKVIGVPQPTLRWFKDGVELKPGDIHRIISGKDGACSLGTYTCEAKNCMGIVTSSATLLGYEENYKNVPKPEPQNILQRHLSLSTIHEERTSQLYDTPMGDITVDEKGDVSFSFDGKEVSVSLYETPDLTEEEALQIVEMYADQISEHVTEQNIVELPPLRFVKETTQSGNLLMEAVVIDVSPDYFPPDEDMRTEADMEDISVVDPMSGNFEDPLSEQSASKRRRKEESMRSCEVEEFFSLSQSKQTKPMSILENYLVEEVHSDEEITETDLQTFESAKSSQRDSENKKIKLDDSLQEPPALPPRKKPAIESKSKDDDSIYLTDISGEQGDGLKTHKRRIDITTITINKTVIEIIKRNVIIVREHLTAVENEVIAQSTMMMTPASAESSIGIVRSVLEPISAIESKMSEYNGERSVEGVVENLLHDLKSLNHGLSIIEKCVEMDAEGRTLVQRTSVCVIESVGEQMLTFLECLKQVCLNHVQGSLQNESLLIINDMQTGIHITEDTIKSQTLMQEASALEASQRVSDSVAQMQQPSMVPLQVMTTSELPKEANSFKLLCRYILKFQELLENSQKNEIKSETLKELKKPITDIQSEIQAIEEKISKNSLKDTIEEKISFKILDTVSPPLYELNKCFEVISRNFEDGNCNPKILEPFVLPLQEIQTGLALIGHEIDSGFIKKESPLDTEDNHKVVKTVSQNIIYLDSNIENVREKTSATVYDSLGQLKMVITTLVEDIKKESLTKGTLQIIYGLKVPIEELNYCFRHMEERSMSGSLRDLLDPLNSLRENMEVVEEKLRQQRISCHAEELTKIKTLVDQCDAEIQLFDIIQLDQQERVNQQLMVERQISDYSQQLSEFEQQSVNKQQQCDVLANVQENIINIQEIIGFEQDKSFSEHMSTLKTLANPLQELSRQIANIREEILLENVNEISAEDYKAIRMLAKPLRDIFQQLATISKQFTLETAQIFSSLSNQEVLKTLATPLAELRNCIAAIQHECVTLYEIQGQLEHPLISLKTAKPLEELRMRVEEVIHHIMEPDDLSATLDDVSIMKTQSDLSEAPREVVKIEEVVVLEHKSEEIQSETILKEKSTSNLIEEETKLIKTEADKSMVTIREEIEKVIVAIQKVRRPSVELQSVEKELNEVLESLCELTNNGSKIEKIIETIQSAEMALAKKKTSDLILVKYNLESLRNNLVEMRNAQGVDTVDLVKLSEISETKFSEKVLTSQKDESMIINEESIENDSKISKEIIEQTQIIPQVMEKSVTTQEEIKIIEPLLIIENVETEKSVATPQTQQIIEVKDELVKIQKPQGEDTVKKLSEISESKLIEKLSTQNENSIKISEESKCIEDGLIIETTKIVEENKIIEEIKNVDEPQKQVEESSKIIVEFPEQTQVMETPITPQEEIKIIEPLPIIEKSETIKCIEYIQSTVESIQKVRRPTTELKAIERQLSSTLDHITVLQSDEVQIEKVIESISNVEASLTAKKTADVMVVKDNLTNLKQTLEILKSNVVHQKTEISNVVVEPQTAEINKVSIREAIEVEILPQDRDKFLSKAKEEIDNVKFSMKKAQSTPELQAVVQELTVALENIANFGDIEGDFDKAIEVIQVAESSIAAHTTQEMIEVKDNLATLKQILVNLKKLAKPEKLVVDESLQKSEEAKIEIFESTEQLKIVESNENLADVKVDDKLDQCESIKAEEPINDKIESIEESSQTQTNQQLSLEATKSKFEEIKIIESSDDLKIVESNENLAVTVEKQKEISKSEEDKIKLEEPLKIIEQSDLPKTEEISTIEVPAIIEPPPVQSESEECITKSKDEIKQALDSIDKIRRTTPEVQAIERQLSTTYEHVNDLSNNEKEIQEIINSIDAAEASLAARRTSDIALVKQNLESLRQSLIILRTVTVQHRQSITTIDIKPQTAEINLIEGKDDLKIEESKDDKVETQQEIIETIVEEISTNADEKIEQITKEVAQTTTHDVEKTILKVKQEIQEVHALIKKVRRPTSELQAAQIEILMILENVEGIVNDPQQIEKAIEAIENAEASLSARRTSDIVVVKNNLASLKQSLVLLNTTVKVQKEKLQQIPKAQSQLTDLQIIEASDDLKIVESNENLAIDEKLIEEIKQISDIKIIETSEELKIIESSENIAAEIIDKKEIINDKINVEEPTAKLDEKPSQEILIEELKPKMPEIVEQPKPKMPENVEEPKLKTPDNVEELLKSNQIQLNDQPRTQEIIEVNLNIQENIKQPEEVKLNDSSLQSDQELNTQKVSEEINISNVEEIKEKSTKEISEVSQTQSISDEFNLQLNKSKDEIQTTVDSIHKVRRPTPELQAIERQLSSTLENITELQSDEKQIEKVIESIATAEVLLSSKKTSDVVVVKQNLAALKESLTVLKSNVISQEVSDVSKTPQHAEVELIKEEISEKLHEKVQEKISEESNEQVQIIKEKISEEVNEQVQEEIKKDLPTPIEQPKLEGNEPSLSIDKITSEISTEAQISLKKSKEDIETVMFSIKKSRHPPPEVTNVHKALITVYEQLFELPKDEKVLDKAIETIENAEIALVTRGATDLMVIKDNLGALKLSLGNIIAIINPERTGEIMAQFAPPQTAEISKTEEISKDEIEVTKTDIKDNLELQIKSVVESIQKSKRSTPELQAVEKEFSFAIENVLNLETSQPKIEKVIELIEAAETSLIAKKTSDIVLIKENLTIIKETLKELKAPEEIKSENKEIISIEEPTKDELIKIDESVKNKTVEEVEQIKIDENVEKVNLLPEKVETEKVNVEKIEEQPKESVVEKQPELPSQPETLTSKDISQPEMKVGDQSIKKLKSEIVETIASIKKARRPTKELIAVENELNTAIESINELPSDGKKIENLVISIENAKASLEVRKTSDIVIVKSNLSLLKETLSSMEVKKEEISEAQKVEENKKDSIMPDTQKESTEISVDKEIETKDGEKPQELESKIIEEPKLLQKSIDEGVKEVLVVEEPKTVIELPQNSKSLQETIKEKPKEILIIEESKTAKEPAEEKPKEILIIEEPKTVKKPAEEKLSKVEETKEIPEEKLKESEPNKIVDEPKALVKVEEPKSVTKIELTNEAKKIKYQIDQTIQSINKARKPTTELTAVQNVFKTAIENVHELPIDNSKMEALLIKIQSAEESLSAKRTSDIITVKVNLSELKETLIKIKDQNEPKKSEILDVEKTKMAEISEPKSVDEKSKEEINSEEKIEEKQKSSVEEIKAEENKSEKAVKTIDEPISEVKIVEEVKPAITENIIDESKNDSKVEVKSEVIKEEESSKETKTHEITEDKPTDANKIISENDKTPQEIKIEAPPPEKLKDEPKKAPEIQLDANMLKIKTKINNTLQLIGKARRPTPEMQVVEKELNETLANIGSLINNSDLAIKITSSIEKAEDSLTARRTSDIMLVKEGFSSLKQSLSKLIVKKEKEIVEENKTPESSINVEPEKPKLDEKVIEEPKVEKVAPEVKVENKLKETKPENLVEEPKEIPKVELQAEEKPKEIEEKPKAPEKNPKVVEELPKALENKPKEKVPKSDDIELPTEEKPIIEDKPKAPEAVPTILEDNKLKGSEEVPKATEEKVQKSENIVKVELSKEDKQIIEQKPELIEEKPKALEEVTKAVEEKPKDLVQKLDDGIKSELPPVEKPIIEEPKIEIPKIEETESVKKLRADFDKVLVSIKKARRPTVELQSFDKEISAILDTLINFESDVNKIENTIKNIENTEGSLAAKKTSDIDSVKDTLSSLKKSLVKLRDAKNPKVEEIKQEAPAKIEEVKVQEENKKSEEKPIEAKPKEVKKIILDDTSRKLKEEIEKVIQTIQKARRPTSDLQSYEKLLNKTLENIAEIPSNLSKIDYLIKNCNDTESSLESKKTSDMNLIKSKISLLKDSLVKLRNILVPPKEPEKQIEVKKLPVEPSKVDEPEKPIEVKELPIEPQKVDEPEKPIEVKELTVEPLKVKEHNKVIETPEILPSQVLLEFEEKDLMLQYIVGIKQDIEEVLVSLKKLRRPPTELTTLHETLLDLKPKIDNLNNDSSYIEKVINIVSKAKASLLTKRTMDLIFLRDKVTSLENSLTLLKSTIVTEVNGEIIAAKQKEEIELKSNGIKKTGNQEILKEIESSESEPERPSRRRKTDKIIEDEKISQEKIIELETKQEISDVKKEEPEVPIRKRNQIEEPQVERRPKIETEITQDISNRRHPQTQPENGIEPIKPTRRRRTDEIKEEPIPRTPEGRRRRMPTFIARLKNRSAAENSILKLTCALSEPDCTVKWTKDGTIVKTSEKYCIENNNGVLSLEVMNVCARDAGEYCCFVSNVCGEIETSAFVTIFGEDVQQASTAFTKNLKGE